MDPDWAPLRAVCLVRLWIDSSITGWSLAHAADHTERRNYLGEGDTVSKCLCEEQLCSQGQYCCTLLMDYNPRAQRPQRWAKAARLQASASYFRHRLLIVLRGGPVDQSAKDLSIWQQKASLPALQASRHPSACIAPVVLSSASTNWLLDSDRK